MKFLMNFSEFKVGYRRVPEGIQRVIRRLLGRFNVLQKISKEFQEILGVSEG